MIYNKNMKRLSKVIALTFAFNCVSPTLFAYAADATATTSTTASEQSALDAAKAKVAEATKTIENAVKGTSESKKTVASTTAQTASNNTAILQNAINIIMSKDGRDSYGRQYTAEEKALAAIQVGEQFGLTDKDTLAKMQAQLDDATKVAEEQKVDVPNEVQQAKKLLNAYTEAVSTMGSDTLSTILQGTHDPAVELSTLRTLYNKAKVQAQQDCQSATTSKTNAASAVTLAQQSYDNITKAIEESQEEISSLEKNDKVAADTKKSELEKANTALEALKTKQKSAQTALDEAKKASETAVSDEKTKCDTNTLSDDAKAYSKAIAALEMQQVNANSNAKATTATDATTTKNSDGSTTATCGSGMTLIQDSNKCCPANQPYYRSGKNGVLGCYSTATDTASTSSTSSSKKDDKDNFSNLIGMMAMMGGFGQNSDSQTKQPAVGGGEKKDTNRNENQTKSVGQEYMAWLKQQGINGILQLKNANVKIAPEHEGFVEHNVNVPSKDGGTAISNVYDLNANGDDPLTVTVTADGASAKVKKTSKTGETTEDISIGKESLSVIVRYYVKTDKSGTKFVMKTATGKLGEPITLLTNDGKGGTLEYVGGAMNTPMPIYVQVVGSVSISNGKKKSAGTTNLKFMSLAQKDIHKTQFGYKYVAPDVSISGEDISKVKSAATEIKLANADATDADLNKLVEDLDGTTEELTGQIQSAKWEDGVCKISVSDENGMNVSINADSSNNIGEKTCNNIGSSMVGKTTTFNSKFSVSKDENGKEIGKLALSGNLFLMDGNRQPIGIESYYSDVDAKAILGKLAYQPTQATISSTGASYPLFYNVTNGKWYNQDFTEVNAEGWKAETGIDLKDLQYKDGMVVYNGTDLSSNGLSSDNLKSMNASSWKKQNDMPEQATVGIFQQIRDAVVAKVDEAKQAVKSLASGSNDGSSVIMAGSKHDTRAILANGTMNEAVTPSNSTKTKAKVSDNQKKSTLDKVKDFANHAVNSATSYASRFGIDIKKFTKTGDIDTVTGQNMANRAEKL